jgi:hypothetical protein
VCACVCVCVCVCVRVCVRACARTCVCVRVLRPDRHEDMSVTMKPRYGIDLGFGMRRVCRL